MTIIAGFCVQETGILLAADSMYTSLSKVHEPKLFGYTLEPSGIPESCTLAFALSGDTNFAKMAIQDCVQAVEDTEPQQRILRNVEGALRYAVKHINDEYVDTRPTAAERDSASFELIIGAWLPLAGGLHMFRTNGPAVLRVGEYCCAGSGSYLGDYLMRKAQAVFKRSMSMNEISLLAIRALSAVKEYDAWCGGDSQFMQIAAGGEIGPLVEYNIQATEQYLSDFDTAVQKLMFRLWHLDAETDRFPADARFGKQLDEFVDEIKRIRANWGGGGFDYLVNLLTKLSARASASPQATTDDPSHRQPSPESPEESDGS